MIEATVTVVRLDGRTTWVEAETHSACGHCGSAVSCGTGLLAGLFSRRRRLIAVDGEGPYRVGERLVVGVSDELLRRASLAAYLLPLLSMTVLAALVDAAGAGDAGAALGAVAGLAIGILTVAWHTRRSSDSYRPRVLWREAGAFSLTALNLGVER